MACWKAHPPGKSEALEGHPGPLESPRLENVKRWKGTLGRWKAPAWKKRSAGKARWSAGKLPLGKNGALERHAGALESSRLEKMERWKATPFGTLKV